VGLFHVQILILSTGYLHGHIMCEYCTICVMDG